MQWTKGCICNSGKTNFDAIEFSTNSSRIELFCGKCHGIICWWPINIEQITPFSGHGIKERSLVTPTKTK